MPGHVRFKDMKSPGKVNDETVLPRMTWMIPVRIVVVAAWAFNLIVLGGTLVQAWKREDAGHILGIGVLFFWLLFLGGMGLGTVVPIGKLTRRARSE
jgi:hypothetical protein